MEPCLFCSDMLLRAEISTARYLHGDTDQSSSSCKCHYLTCGASLELGRRVARDGRGLVSSAPFLQPLGYFPVECLHPVRHQQRAVLAAVVAEVAHGAGDAGGVAVGGGEGRGRVLGVAEAGGGAVAGGSGEEVGGLCVG